MGNELARQMMQTMDDVDRAARAMSASGFFSDARQASQAVVKILAGMELGFGPFASMTGVNIIQNKPVLAANLIAAAVKRTGKYNYRVVEMTDRVCEIAFFESGQEVGRSRFTWEDAEKAGLVNKDVWRKFPRNMLFARALSNGQKWYAPDVFNGATVYTPDEVGATVDEDGAVIVDGKATDPPPVQSAPPAEKPKRPYAPDVLRDALVKASQKHGNASASDKQIGLAAMLLAACFAGEGADDKRHAVQFYLTGQPSLKTAAPAMVLALLDWLKPTQDSGGAYHPDEMAVSEANGVLLLAAAPGETLE